MSDEKNAGKYKQEFKVGKRRKLYKVSLDGKRKFVLATGSRKAWITIELSPGEKVEIRSGSN